MHLWNEPYIVRDLSILFIDGVRKQERKKEKITIEPQSPTSFQLIYPIPSPDNEVLIEGNPLSYVENSPFSSQ